MSLPILEVHTINDLIKKAGWTHMQQTMFPDRFVENENERLKADWKICGNSMWFPFNSETCTDYTREKWLSDFYAFIKEKKIHRKSFGQIGVKYLLLDNDFNLFSC